VDRFDENIANIVSGGLRKSGITFAPEAGTQRMRDIINKGLSNEELLRGVKTAFDQGWWQVSDTRLSSKGPMEHIWCW
jgi:radical SAM superfamily enzyme YgiQ (UPF0313 family)